MNNKQSVPKLTIFMAVILKLIAKLGGTVEAPRKTLPPFVKTELRLSAEAVAKCKKNGSPLYVDRTGWSLTYLKKAGLLNFPKRGTANITPRGEAFLSKNEITIKDLLQFPEFVEFYDSRKRLAEANLISTQFINPSNLADSFNKTSTQIIEIDNEVLFDYLKAMPSNVSLINRNGKLALVKRN